MSPGLQIDRCVCKCTLFAQLLPRARERGWDLGQLMAETGCGAQCGLCRPYLREMLRSGVTVFHKVLTESSDEGEIA